MIFTFEHNMLDASSRSHTLHTLSHRMNVNMYKTTRILFSSNLFTNFSLYVIHSHVIEKIIFVVKFDMAKTMKSLIRS